MFRLNFLCFFFLLSLYSFNKYFLVRVIHTVLTSLEKSIIYYKNRTQVTVPFFVCFSLIFLINSNDFDWAVKAIRNLIRHVVILQNKKNCYCRTSLLGASQQRLHFSPELFLFFVPTPFFFFFNSYEGLFKPPPQNGPGYPVGT